MPLNRTLYEILRQKLGSVRILHEGEAMQAIPIARTDTIRPHLHIVHSGEYYAANCPFCNDTRHRLYVNHMYGQQDKYGRRLNFLAVCYNESCLDNAENQHNFRELLASPMLRAARVTKGIEVSSEAREVVMPGQCTWVDKLPHNHPARRYLESRHFDPNRIGRFYGVTYCHSSPYRLVEDRLVIPVYDDGVLRSWQARYVGERNWKKRDGESYIPKYFSCPNAPKSMLLYNFDNARHYATGIIVEGPTDVWSFGPMAVCTLGSHMSEIQFRKFLAVFRERKAILLFDPEAFEQDSTKRLITRFKAKMPGAFAAVKLPNGTDPGAMDRKVLRAYVAFEAEKSGLIVDYGKWNNGRCLETETRALVPAQRSRHSVRGS